MTNTITITFPERPPWSGIGADGWDHIACPDDLHLLSASSVSKALASPGLERWAMNTTVQMLIDEMPKFQRLAGEDPEAAVKWASQLRYQPKVGAELNAADSGTAMHSLLEAWLGDTQPSAELVGLIERDTELTAMATNLWRWYCRFRPEAVAIEQVVYDPQAGIAGRLDAIVRFAALPELGNSLVDLKTSREARYKSGGIKRPFGDSHALQLSCYRYAPLTATFEPRLLITQRKSSNRVYLLNPAEQAACAPSVQIDSTCILQLNPERCDLYPLDTGPGVRRRALEAMGLNRWINEESKSVVGDPIAPPLDLPDLGGEA